MPWRLIGCVVVLIILLGFIGFNLENRCDISFGPRGLLTISQAPVYFTAFAAFALGMLCSIPLAVSLGKKKPKGPTQGKPKKREQSKAEILEPVPDDGTYGID
ncbi:MAG: hypothetical protein LBJ24_09025 [Treponema sp.]|jgi:hypothetical protein|nr:hypothetical protein [Treponema sp.]